MTHQNLQHINLVAPCRDSFSAQVFVWDGKRVRSGGGEGVRASH